MHKKDHITTENRVRTECSSTHIKRACPFSMDNTRYNKMMLYCSGRSNTATMQTTMKYVNDSFHCHWVEFL